VDELRASETFIGTHGLNYWTELIEAEQKIDKRYIGQIGSSHWLSSFVSLGILGEIVCVLPDVFSINDFNDDHIRDLVSGLLRVFEYYSATDIYSFNASLFFGPEGQECFSCHFRIAARTFLNTRDYAPDLNFFQALLSEPVSVIMPEELCTAIKAHF